MSVFTGQSGGLFENYVSWVTSSDLEYKGGYLPTSGSVTIGDYTIKSNIQVANRVCPAGTPSCTQGLAKNCAPSGTNGWNYGCYTKLQVYKSGKLINEAERCDMLTSTSSGTMYLPDGLTIEPLWKTIHGDMGGAYSCQIAINTYSIHVPNDVINVSVATPQTQYFEGQDVSVDVVIYNGWMEGVGAQLDTTFEIPTMIGSATSKESKNITLKLGENRVSYTLPTVKNTEKIRITPSVSITLPKSKISGLNEYSNGAYRPNSADFNMGTVTEKTFEVMIVPKPLYMTPNTDGSCLAGYSINAARDYCVRDDIKSLTCYQIGCPKVVGHDYSCTSAGQCAETVYKTVWGTCPAGTTPTTTDKGEQVCIKSEIATKILQCDANTPTMTPCDGVTSSCVNGQLVFSGACNVKTEVQTQYITREVVVEKTIWGKCPDTSREIIMDDGSHVCVQTVVNYQTIVVNQTVYGTCPSGTQTFKDANGGQVCVQKEYVTQYINQTQTVTKTIEVPVIKEVTKTEYISTSYIPTWVYVVGGIGIMIVFALMIKKKKR